MLDLASSNLPLAEGWLPAGPADTPPRPVPPTPALAVWQAHHGGAGTPMALAADQGAALSPAPLPGASLSALRDLLAPLAGLPVALVYVARGHQVQYRSPVLPRLLAALPPFAAVHALRAEVTETDCPAAARHLAAALVAGGLHCLLLDDHSRRLLPGPPANAAPLPSLAPADPGGLAFTLFAPLPHALGHTPLKEPFHDCS